MNRHYGNYPGTKLTLDQAIEESKLPSPIIKRTIRPFKHPLIIQSEVASDPKYWNDYVRDNRFIQACRVLFVFPSDRKISRDIGCIYKIEKSLDEVHLVKGNRLFMILRDWSSANQFYLVKALEATHQIQDEIFRKLK